MLEAATLPLSGRQDSRLVKVDQILDELVRVHGLDAEWRQCGCGEVFQVEGHSESPPPVHSTTKAAEGGRRQGRKAEAYLRQNPSRGTAVFQLPEQLAIVDPR